MSKSKKALADSLSKTFILSVKRNGAKSVGNDTNALNGYTVGYLESFLASLMATNPKVLATVVERMQAHATQE